MGEVALQYRILPNDPQVDLDALLKDITKALPEGAVLRTSEKKPVAFGLNALHVLIVIEDKEGGADKTESALAGVPGVQSVEIIQMGLL
ncbi:MAG: elongation factor 1-beta [Methanobacteriota archaeon]|nr:MAG: elongation factor 1-beta [Euryarchaeota archaeon]